MVACARRNIVDRARAGVYHCWTRCVRQAYLCGKDSHTKKDYSHRRGWIRERMEQLAALFAIEVGFFSVMQNHLHLVLKTRPHVASRWSKLEAARRWLTITRLAKCMDDSVPLPNEKRVELLSKDKKKMARIRRRLSSVSWYMGILSENIARRSNFEDKTSGRFWEKRFACRRCTSEAAVLICGMYVDLNPIRAGEATTPETSRFTSAFDRIESRRQRKRGKRKTVDGWMCELTLQEGPREDIKGRYESRSGRRASDQGLIPVTLDKYLELLDWTGRQFREGKRGAIPAHLAPILERLKINEEYWLEALECLDEWFGPVVGRAADLAQAAADTGRKWIKGTKAAARVFK
jgi:REP element-mobilizing transposase RayT